jgi:hypothetical protein
MCHEFPTRRRADAVVGLKAGLGVGRRALSEYRSSSCNDRIPVVDHRPVPPSSTLSGDFLPEIGGGVVQNQALGDSGGEAL